MNKPILVLDTNIFISSIFWEGKPFIIVQKAIRQDIIVFVSNEIIGEIRRILARDFELERQEIDDITDAITLFTHLVEPREKVEVVKDDPEDNRILECALSCYAQFIVTRDRHLLKLKEFRGVYILHPEEFLKLLSVKCTRPL